MDFLSGVDLDKPYPSINKDTVFHVTIGRGKIAFRYGPFTGAEAGKIAERCADDSIPYLITADCVGHGPFDWELATALSGHAWDRQAAALLRRVKAMSDNSAASMDVFSGSGVVEEIDGLLASLDDEVKPPKPSLNSVQIALSFAKSTIKSGERWSEACEAIFKSAEDELAEIV